MRAFTDIYGPPGLRRDMANPTMANTITTAMTAIIMSIHVLGMARTDTDRFTVLLAAYVLSPAKFTATLYEPSCVGAMRLIV